MVRHARRSRTPAGRSTDRKTHAMTEEPLHPRRDLTNDELVRYLESEPVTIPRPRSDSSPLSSRRYLLAGHAAAGPIWHPKFCRGRGGAFCSELLSAVGGHGPEGTEGRPPYPTGHTSSRCLLSLKRSLRLSLNTGPLEPCRCKFIGRPSPQRRARRVSSFALGAGNKPI